jgi:hypothetical protein
MLGRLSWTPTDPLVPPDIGKVSASGASLYGCFSPHTKVGSVVKAPVMQIMPELLDLCGDVAMPSFVTEARSDSHEISNVAPSKSHALRFVSSVVVGMLAMMSLFFLGPTCKCLLLVLGLLICLKRIYNSLCSMLVL